MSDLAVLIPVLGRPHRVTPTIDAFEATMPDARIVMLPDWDDRDELAAIKADKRCDLAPCPPGSGYGWKINHGVVVTTSPLIFLAADDLEPQPGWFETACGYLRDGVQVVGVNDTLERPYVWPTCFLITREYADWPALDGKRGPLAECYVHGPCDHELVITAQHRGVFAYADDAHVKHLHPRWGTASWDATYLKGENSMKADWELWEARCAEHLPVHDRP